MNEIITGQSCVAPHLLPQNRIHSPGHIGSSSSYPSSMSGRKRKADDGEEADDRMSTSPANSPAIAAAVPPSAAPPRSTKRARTNFTGRPLPLPRLLETLGAEELRSLLRSICDRHPDLGSEVVHTAPRPSLASVRSVLEQYESSLRAAFPFGGRPGSDYAYNRVRQQLADLLEALREYTPHFLPPHEIQPSKSVEYLEVATQMISRLPDWDTNQHNRHKLEAYEEISKAWALAIREAGKRGGGIQLQYGGWDQRLAKLNDNSGGRLEEAMQELRASLGWLGAGSTGSSASAAASSGCDPTSIRQQLLSGTYGSGHPVRVGPW